MHGDTFLRRIRRGLQQEIEMPQKRRFYFTIRPLMLLSIVGIVMVNWGLPVAAAPLRPEVETFIVEMVEKHAFERESLERLFTTAKFQPAIITAISRPTSSRPWHEYRPLFINPKRVAGGISFWEANAATLGRAQKEFGIPEEIITGLIGVETIYGAQTGKHRVLDALTTLAFDYPSRAVFFRSELEQYLLLSRERGADVFDIKGSYAGAIGIPQFMPSSYRRYAVDFDGDGKVDLSNNPVDAIGSVANYLKAFGWEADGPIAVRAQISGEGYREALLAGIKPLRTLEELKKLGVTPPVEMSGERPAALIELDNNGVTEYWLSFENFYVITRYNRSVYYAMSVLQLAEEIRAARNLR